MIRAGEHGFEHHDIRAGVQVDVWPNRITMAFDFDWQWQHLKFGRHAGLLEQILGRQLQGRIKGHVYRYLAGIEVMIVDVFSVQTGYRYTDARYNDWCGSKTKYNYSTVSFGFTALVWNKHVNIRWHSEYSWIVDGDFVTAIVVSYNT